MTFSLEFLIRVIILFLFFLWQMYWIVTEKAADKEKPKTQKGITLFNTYWFRRFALKLFSVLVVVQLIGVEILPIQAPLPFLFSFQIIGFVFVLIGVSVAISARKTIGTNWAHAFEYQIKKKQDLVTTGVYRFIRHPIYSGLLLSLLGAELVSQSYLVFVLPLLIWGGYKQAKQEEQILIGHFGNAYKTYMKHTKMFIPYLW